MLDEVLQVLPAFGEVLPLHNKVVQMHNEELTAPLEDLSMHYEVPRVLQAVVEVLLMHDQAHLW